MVYCAVLFCKRRSELANMSKDGVSYYMFPKHPVLRTQWMKFCRRHYLWVPKRTSVICSDHFDPSCFLPVSNPKGKRRLHQTAMPTIPAPDPEGSSTNIISEPANYVLSLEEQKLSSVSDPLSDLKSELDSQPMLPTEAMALSQPSSSLPLPSLQQSPITSSFELEDQDLKEEKNQLSSLPESLPGTLPESVPNIKWELEIKPNQAVPFSQRSPAVASLFLQVETPIVKKLKNQIQLKNMKIKRLQGKNRYLIKKLDELQGALNHANEKCLIAEEERSILEKKIYEKNGSISRVFIHKKPL